MRILVGVDHGSESLTALRWAMRLAADVAQSDSPPGAASDRARSCVEVLVAQSWEYPAVPLLRDPAHGADPDEIDRRVLISLREFVDRSLGELVRRLPGVRVEHLVLRGSPAFALHRAALERHCDLVVVGTRALEPADQHVFGSVSHSLTGSGDLDVVVVPPSTVPSAGPIVVGYDESPDGLAAARWAGRLAGSMAHGEVVFVHHCAYGALAPVDAAMPIGVHEYHGDDARRISSDLGLDELVHGTPHRSVAALGDAVAGLEQVASLARARLVVVGAHGSPATERWRFTSLSKRLSAHHAFPLAVIRDRTS